MRIIKSLLFAFAMGQAFAQTQGISVTAEKSFTHGISANAKLEYRTDKNLSGLACLKFEVMAGWRINPWLKAELYCTPMIYKVDGELFADGSYFNSFYQFRPRYSFALTGYYRVGALNFSLRERYQLTCRPTKNLEMFDPHGVAEGLRSLSKENAQVLRSRLKIMCNTGGILSPYTSIEPYNSLTHGFRLNETRYSWGFNIDITPSNSLDIYYLLISYGGRHDNAHFFHFGYTYSF